MVKRGRDGKESLSIYKRKIDRREGGTEDLTEMRSALPFRRKGSPQKGKKYVLAQG